MSFFYLNKIIYYIAISIFVGGGYIISVSSNLMKKIMGLGMLQNGILLFYIAVGKVKDSNIPVLTEGETLYSNPVPHVLMLTAIVVGFATLSLGLAMIIKINDYFLTIDELEIEQQK